MLFYFYFKQEYIAEKAKTFSIIFKPILLFSGTCISTKSLLLVATLFVYLSSNGVLMSPVGGEGMVPEFMAGLNSVPRMGRRSMNPFMRSALGGGGSTSTNSGGFRFLNSRPRRRSGPYNPFGGGFPAFRFVGGPGLYQVGNKILSLQSSRVVVIT